MFVALWEFEVKPRREQRFQEVYRPGDCDSLFRADPNHAGTRLFRDTARSNVYLTADYWLSRKSYEEFLALRRSEYKTLDAASEDLTLSERHIGSLEVLRRPEISRDGSRLPHGRADPQSSEQSRCQRYDVNRPSWLNFSSVPTKRLGHRRRDRV